MKTHKNPTKNKLSVPVNTETKTKTVHKAVYNIYKHTTAHSQLKVRIVFCVSLAFTGQNTANLNNYKCYSIVKKKTIKTKTKHPIIN